VEEFQIPHSDGTVCLSLSVAQFGSIILILKSFDVNCDNGSCLCCSNLGGCRSKLPGCEIELTWKKWMLHDLLPELQ